MRPRGGLRRYVCWLVVSAVAALASAFGFMVVAWLFGWFAGMSNAPVFGVVIGPFFALTTFAAMRSTTLQVSFDGHEELFKKVVEIAVSGAGHEVVYEGDALLVWMRAFQLDVFKWGVRVQIEGNTATIVGPVPLAMRLRNTIEVATLVARWTLLFASEAQVA
jgi:hypothetical protein